MQPVWSKHAAAIRADAALQQLLASLLLARGLPGLALDLEGDSRCGYTIDLNYAGSNLLHIASSMRNECLVPALLRQLRQQGGLAAAVKAAVCIMHSLPAQCPTDAERCNHARAWVVSVQNITQLVSLATVDMPGQNYSQARGSTAPGTPDLEQVAALMLGVLPQLATALLSAATGACPAGINQLEWLHNLATWCTNLATVLRCALSPITAVPADELSIWPQAAAAGLQLQPLLLQLEASFRDLPGVSNAAMSLSEQLIQVIAFALSVLTGTPRSEAAAAGRRACSSAAAMLHSQLCRLVHHLATGGSLLTGNPWNWLLRAMHATLEAAALPYLPPELTAALPYRPPDG